MLTYCTAPATIQSPITGNTLTKVAYERPGYSVAEFFVDSTECFDSYVVRYTDPHEIENIYISVEAIGIPGEDEIDLL